MGISTAEQRVQAFSRKVKQIRIYSHASGLRLPARFSHVMCRDSTPEVAIFSVSLYFWYSWCPVPSTELVKTSLKHICHSNILPLKHVYLLVRHTEITSNYATAALHCAEKPTCNRDKYSGQRNETLRTVWRHHGRETQKICVL